MGDEARTSRARKRFVGPSNAVTHELSIANKAAAPCRKRNAIPETILADSFLNSAINTSLPNNYNFEIHKSVHMLRENNVKRVALQMPEGLLMYALTIGDIFERIIL